MHSYSSIINRPSAVILSANVGAQSHGTLSSLIAHRVRPLHAANAAKSSIPILQVPACKGKEMEKLSSKGAFITSPPSSSSPPTGRLSSRPFVKILRTPGFLFLMSENKGLQCPGHQYNPFMMQLISEKLIASRLLFDTIQVRVLDTFKRRYMQSLVKGRKSLIALIVAMICLTCPTFFVTPDVSIGISTNVAFAQSFGQIRQAALFLERLGGSTSTKVLDKVVTVISGQTVVTPETIDKLKSIIENETLASRLSFGFTISYRDGRSGNAGMAFPRKSQSSGTAAQPRAFRKARPGRNSLWHSKSSSTPSLKDPRDWQADLADNIGTLWSTTVDVVSQFNPNSLVEATGNGIQGLVEASAERFAAFELSTLVALGERWILWTPFVILPMYWQMTRNKENEEKDRDRVEKSPAVAVELSEAAVAKAARVRDELERIELKASLLDLVYSLGKLAWQSSGANQDTKRRQIDELLTMLQDLNPTSSSDLGSALVKVPSAESPYIQPFMDVDGDWTLIYVSQDSNQGEQTQFAQLMSLNIPGFELSNMRQKLWRKGLKTAVLTSESDGEPLVAKNTAQVRLGPLGVVEISVQGSWENQNNGKSAVVSFDTFSAKPIEVLGSRVREDLPPLDVAIPSALQTSGEWKTVYLDNSLRINRGGTGQFFLFRKSQ